VSDETWLAIDTATDVASVAVRVREQTFTRSIRGARQHAAQIVPLIADVLKAAQLPLDALRGQVYGAVYEFTEDAVKTLVPADVFTIAQLAAAAPRRPELAVGDGAARYRAEVQQWTGRPPVDLDALPPIAGSLLALYEYEGARSPRADTSVAEPVYGRPAEAQVKWETRHGRSLPHSSR